MTKTLSKPRIPEYRIDSELFATCHNTWNEIFYLEIDGIRPHDPVLTEVGAEMKKVAMCNLPVHLTHGRFWGYNHPKDDGIMNCEPPRAGDALVLLSSPDEKALLAIAEVLSDARCWEDDSDYHKLFSSNVLS